MKVPEKTTPESAGRGVGWIEQTAADLPAVDDWLSEAEAVRQQGLRIPKRRADWRLGRWTAKHAVAAYLNSIAPLAAIEIRAAADGAPEAWVAGQPAGLSISISHRDGTAICAAAPVGVALGCDLELIEPRGAAFVADYFTDAEQSLIAQADESGRHLLVTLIWSAKESVLKALREGLRLDTRSVAVTIEGHTGGLWHPFRARYEQRDFWGWWREAGGLVRTVATEPLQDAPIALRRWPDSA